MRFCQALPFWKFVRGLTPLSQQKWGGGRRWGAHYVCQKRLQINSEGCFKPLFNSIKPALIQVVFHVGDRFWERENRRPKNYKAIFFFQNNFYSLKAHAYYFTVIIYLAPCRAAKLDIFTHFMFTNIGIRCGQSTNSLIYVYSIQVPSCFLWMLDHTRDCTSSYYHPPPQKKFCITPC